MERRIVVGAVGRAFSIGRTIGGEVSGLVGVKVLSAEFYFHKPITVHLELYLFYCFIHFLLYIGHY